MKIIFKVLLIVILNCHTIVFYLNKNISSIDLYQIYLFNSFRLSFEECQFL